jgi:multidrug efflux pump subunit AcrB
VSGATDVRIAQRLDYPILKVEIDRIKAAYLGVNVEDVVKNLVTATNSSINFDPAFWIDPKSGNHYFIGAQYSEEAINSLETLYDIPITGQNSSRPVMLQNLAKITREKGPAVINHHNITRVIDVYANVERGYDMGSVVANIERRLEASSELGVIAKTSERGDYYEVAGSEFKGKGYTLNLSGEVHSMRNAFGQFTSGLVIAVILVYLVMVAQFKSFLDPLIIMLNIPLGFIGVSFLMYFTGTNLSIQSFMGIIMTVGIVVEYSIILVDFANRRMEQGMSPPDAILDAARTRLRPILMTSLTTVLALLPMGIGIAGGEANVPLARAIIGGVLGGTVLSLVVVPCFYVLLKPNHPSPQGVRVGVNKLPLK